jgi:GNAT superfamily N-acetyltransferase
MATFKTRAFRTSKLKENRGLEKELRKSGRFNSKPFQFQSIKSNILFEKVVELFKENFNDDNMIIGEEQPIISIVENSSTYSHISSPSFVISIGNSWLRITPNKFGGLHLSRLQVDENFRGKGIGSFLLSVFSKLILNSVSLLQEDGFNIPFIDLEVLNYVGNGIEVDVKRTISLYEKFGFRVIKNSPSITKMELDVMEMDRYIAGLVNEFNKIKQ